MSKCKLWGIRSVKLAPLLLLTVFSGSVSGGDDNITPGQPAGKITSTSAPIQADALKMENAGTAGVEFFLDGKSEGRLTVNRDSAHIKTLKPTKADTLTVVVDDGDGDSSYDWLMLGVVDSK